MKYSTVAFLVFGSVASFVSVGVSADTCMTARNAALKQRMASAKQSVCSQMDTSVSVEGSPYLYKNPDAGCDLGLSLPGLPNLGSVGLDGIDSCRILKSITGDFVKEVNRDLQDAIEVVSPASKDQNIDLNEALEDRIEAARSEEGRNSGGSSYNNSSNTNNDSGVGGNSGAGGLSGTGTILNMNGGM